MKTQTADRLRNLLSEFLQENGGDPDQLKLRTPRDLKWGDVCSNVLQLLPHNVSKAEDLIKRLEEISEVQKIEVSSSLDLNIHFRPSFWSGELESIEKNGLHYGQDLITTDNVSLCVASSKEDLLSLKSRWNGEALEQLGKILGVKVTAVADQASELKGFRSDAAISKCGEQSLKIALLSNNDEFAIHFSSVKALDRSYENPVFSLPYAEATIKRLLNKAEAEGVLHLGGVVQKASSGALLFEEEKALCQHLVSWPIAAEKCFTEKDMVNLTGFLQRASLLFFEIYKTQRPESSEYLLDEEHGLLRRQLFKSLRSLLIGGLEILGYDRGEEFI
ncbi:hypothetical protein GUA87_12610 [Sneathiella sp. P13V-1]|uniref:hypothetical protein n=1 Tax=Sneathiella sp. P13V-1 TaxID=2697366 RepID=UPI00187BAFAF|nr:hypothetical protein [Sneathiella sp. P13V-1]MBE7637689.1 hypothetical protein [Sneathiella sp. P13V-1]